MARTFRYDSEKVKLYQERIRKAKESHERWSGMAKARINRYRNEADPNDFVNASGHRISTPAGVAIIDSMYSSLTAVDVEVNIHPWGKGTMEQARVAEQAVMEVWREAKVAMKTRTTVKDALLVGLGWVKVGYDYAAHEEIQPKDEATLDRELGSLFKSYVDREEQPPSPEEGLAMVGEEEVVEVVDRDRVVVDYVPWDTVYFDPTAKRTEDIRWIAQITYLPLDEVIGNPEWREYVKKSTGSYKALEDLKPDYRAIYDQEQNTSIIVLPEDQNIEDDEGRVAVVEYWDLTTGGTFCTLPLNGNFLLNEQPNPLGFEEDMEDRNPFVPLVLRTNPDHVRGISDMELMEPTLAELNRYRTILVNYLEKYHPKVMGPGRGMTDPGKDALQSKEDRFVELEEGFDANQFKEMNPPMLPQEILGMPERLQNELRDATGVSEVMRGIFPDRKRTATETAEVVAASSARQSEKRSLMEDFYGAIAQRILHLMQTFYDADRISRLVETDGDIIWEWNADDITMDVDLEVVLAPRQPRDSAWREERAIKLINFVAPVVNQPALHPLTRIALREMGYPMEIIREVLPTEEERAAAAQEQAQQEADAAGLSAEAAAVGAASGDPTVLGGVNGPPQDMSMTQMMGPEGVYQDAAAAQGPMDFLPTP